MSTLKPTAYYILRHEDAVGLKFWSGTSWSADLAHAQKYQTEQAAFEARTQAAGMFSTHEITNVVLYGDFGGDEERD